MRHSPACLLFLFALPGCATQPVDAQSRQAAETSILVRSTPANGATVAGPVNQLTLHFARAARLLEVTVEGPDGLSPMMITAVGEVKDYSVPLSGLGAGAYRANWKAGAAGQTYTATIASTVRG
ncbi:MAG: copper resistance protein CopC [Tardiphaga sp.]|nr:copper resistance protein CopC [Tardiphaga sp.]